MRGYTTIRWVTMLALLMICWWSLWYGDAFICLGDPGCFDVIVPYGVYCLIGLYRLTAILIWSR